MAGNLSGDIVTPSALERAERDAMFQLLTAYFDNVTHTHFVEDLDEKDWVVLLRDNKSGEIKGFSTLMQIRMLVDDRSIIAFFSGDTIIDQAYWGQAELARIWSKHVFGEADRIHASGSGEQVYWFLISSGYKTYRFLPVFFHEFYPNFRTPTPGHARRILDALGGARFPDEYDPESGIIRFSAATPLRDGVAVVTSQRLKDPHIAYFVERNPGYAGGDQLACLVEISRDNVTPAGARVLAALG